MTNTSDETKREMTMEERVERLERVLALIAKGMLDHNMVERKDRWTLESFWEHVTLA